MSKLLADITATAGDGDQDLLRTLYTSSVIEDVNVWLNVLDIDHNIILWNAAAERMSGYGRAEVLGHPMIWEWLYPDRSYRQEILAKVMYMFDRRLDIANFETQIRSKDGTQRNILWNSKSLMDEQGEVYGAITFGYDITEKQRARAALLQAHNDLSVLYDVVSVASASIKLDEILNRALERILSAMGCGKGTVHLQAEEQGELALASQLGFEPEVVQQFAQIAADDQLIGRVFRSGEPLAAPHLADRILHLQGLPSRLLHSYLGVPLRAKGTVLGVFSVWGKAGRVFRDEEIALLSSISDQLGVAVANAQLYRKAQQLAVMDERRRLARDLHDSVTQTLYSMTLFAETGRRLLQRQDLDSADAYLQRLGDTAQRALKEMRLLVYELRPFELDKNGLLASIQHRLDAVECRAGVKAQLIADALPELPASDERELYHIIQEALNNALRHASASMVTVSLRLNDSILSVAVSDNGVGFSLDDVQRRGGMGLSSMRERAERLDARIEIAAQPGAGAQVLLTIDCAARSREGWGGAA